MTKTVFFSWQADTPTREGRNFIEKALENAVSAITKDVAVEQAERPDLAVDKDTKGVPGSPPIFATILNKIEQAAVFVPDLTFVGTRSGNRPISNPNVLIEYGWALKSIGNERIVAVMNEAQGAPSWQTLPFDLASFRFPITYNLQEEASEEARAKERKELAKRFESALREVFEKANFKGLLPKKPEPPPFKAKEPVAGNSRFRKPDEPLGVHLDPQSEAIGVPVSRKVCLTDGPASWLRLMPGADTGRPPWLITDLKQKGLPLAILPLLPSGGEIEFVRGTDGCGFYRNLGREKTPAVAYIFTTGEVWLVSVWLTVTTGHFLLDESAFVKTLEGCASFLESLGISSPYRWIVGMEGMEGFALHLPNRYDRSWGPCVTNLIEEQGTYQTGDKAADLLRPFFERVFDQCGVQRVPLGTKA
jgi:hypothetical protein